MGTCNDKKYLNTQDEPVTTAESPQHDTESSSSQSLLDCVMQNSVLFWASHLVFLPLNRFIREAYLSTGCRLHFFSKHRDCGARIEDGCSKRWIFSTLMAVLTVSDRVVEAGVRSVGVVRRLPEPWGSVQGLERRQPSDCMPSMSFWPGVRCRQQARAVARSS